MGPPLPSPSVSQDAVRATSSQPSSLGAHALLHGFKTEDVRWLSNLCLQPKPLPQHPDRPSAAWLTCHLGVFQIQRPHTALCSPPASMPLASVRFSHTDPLVPEPAPCVLRSEPRIPPRDPLCFLQPVLDPAGSDFPAGTQVIPFLGVKAAKPWQTCWPSLVASQSPSSCCPHLLPGCLLRTAVSPAGDSDPSGLRAAPSLSSACLPPS